MSEREQLRVMVVENERSMLELLQDFFQMQEGMVCCAAASTGREALDLVYSTLPDVLLLDLVMPSPDGLSVLEYLQADPPDPRPGIIVTSAVKGERIVQESIRLGADYYMIKPIDFFELAGRVRMLGRPETRERPAPSPLQVRIENLLLEAGSRGGMVGHGYLIETALRMVTGGRSQYLNAIYKELAEYYKTSENGVSEAIRREMTAMFQRKTPFYCSLPLDLSRPPSPRKFLAAFSARVQELNEKCLKGGIV